MKRKIRHGFFRAGDAAAIALVLFLAVLPLLYHAVQARCTAAAVHIVTDLTEKTYLLTDDKEIEIISSGHTLTVAVENGTVRVTDTDCPSAICAATGAISEVGQSIVCAPARVLIRIIGEEDAHEHDADIILP